MTLRIEQVAGELGAFIGRYRAELARMDAGLDAAGAALERWSGDVAASEAAIREAMTQNDDRRPYALSAGEPPFARFVPGGLEPRTVVAADGSSIEPDRFAAVSCYVVNTGYVVLPYGTAGTAALGSQAFLGPEQPAGEDGDDGTEGGGRGLGVNLVRDVAELEMGESLAAEAVADGDTVLLLDGTLLPWDLDSRQVRKEIAREMQARTRGVLGRLRELGDRLALGAYISGSRAADVVTSLAALSPSRAGWPLADGQLFARLLAEGERSAVFAATSERRGAVEELFRGHGVCFFYLRVGGDIARVEVPEWAANAERLARLHAALVDQCARCGGYPRALQEAHEQAVISGGDRQQFARLLENEAARQGLRAPANGKQWSKRRRAV